jgi:hypothetical protein
MVDCVKQLREIMVGASDDDINRVASEAKRIAEENIGKTTDEIMQAVDNFVADEAILNKIKARNTALNKQAQNRSLEHIDQFDDDVLGLESLLVGVNDVKSNARASVASAQASLQEKYLAGFTSDLEQLSDTHFNGFAEGIYDEDIARALWQIDNGDNFTGLAKEAVDIARVVHKWQETSRMDANEAGAWIKKMPGYITRQSHDMDKIRKAGYEKWFDDISDKLDERTFDGVADRHEFLKSVWEGLSTGIHFKNGQVGSSASLRGFRNVGRAMSQERTLHFKDADSWTAYNKDYGRGELREAVLGSLMTSSHSTGLMKVLGPNAEMNYEAIVESLKKKARATDAIDKLKRTTANNGKIDNFFRTVTGETNIPGGRAMLAQVGAAARGLNSIKMLGTAVVSSISDAPVGASEFRYQDMGFFESYGLALKNMGGALRDMAVSIANRKLTVKSKEHRRVLAELGISLDATTGLMTQRFDPSGDIPGRLSKGLNTFFRLNGLTLWTDSMRAGSMIGMANRIGSYSGLSHGRLPEGVRNVLELYGIGKDEWNLISTVGVKEVKDVGSFITPDMMNNLSPEAVSGYLTKKGIKPTAYQIKKAKRQLEDSLRGYYVDRSQYAVVEPDAKGRAIMLQGTQPGTVMGEMARAFMQFKAFPISIAQKVWGRDIRGRTGKGSSMRAMAEFMVMSTLFGYMAMTAKDLTKNRSPRDPSDPRTWGAAFLQGGGAGIYGDFLFGDMKNRFGGGFVSTIAGPTASQADELFNIFGQVKAGEFDKAGESLFKFGYSNAAGALSIINPYATMLNTAYSKAALDNLIYYNVMESMNPGYKRRLERRMRKENEQEFIFK